MSFQSIDLGTQGTQSGDTIRNAFLKVNSNFVDAQSQIDGKADSGHVHDSRYYTQTQVDAGFRSSSWIPSKANIETSLAGGFNVAMSASGMGLNLWGNNQDIDFRMGHGSIAANRDYGYFWRYKGTGAGNDNALELWTEGQTGADVQVMNLTQDGIWNFLVNPKINGSSIGIIHSHPYRSDSWVPAWTDITGKPSTFAPSSHTHSLSEISNTEDGGELIAADGLGGLTGTGLLADGVFMKDDTLAEVGDVTLSSIGNGELLQWNSTLGEWINRTLAEAGIAATSHSHSAYASKTVAETISGSYNFTNALVEFAQRLGHYGDTNTYIDFATDRITMFAGGSLCFDTTKGAALQCSTGNVLDIDFDEGTGELLIKGQNFWWTSGKIFAKV